MAMTVGVKEINNLLVFISSLSEQSFTFQATSWEIGLDWLPWAEGVGRVPTTMARQVVVYGVTEHK